MPVNRNIEHIIAPPAPHFVGDGFRVHNFFPSQIGETRMSPFFLLDYNSKIDFPPRENPRGVGVHPHRGFETVSIAFHGSIAHHDSQGNSGVIHAGDVQWMTAGSGILHKEYHESEYSKKGGPFQMIQLWVNLPAKNKMTPPAYQDLKNESFGKYHTEAGNLIEVIAGNYKNVKGPAHTFTPIEMYIIRCTVAEEINISLPKHYNAAMLCVESTVMLNGEKKLLQDQLAVFSNDGSEVQIKAEAGSVCFLMAGEPIQEALFAYGPFLMNTYEEVQQAYDDFNKGKFGRLV